MRRNRLGVVATVVAAAVGLSASPALADKTPVRVRSTTDIFDSGLTDALITPQYEALNPNDDLELSSEGTGVAITSAEAGKGDALVTHAPTSEAAFIAAGYSLEPIGRQIFYSDYVIVGPKDDPANVLNVAPHDAISAFELIAAAGDAGKASYVTRNDTSGTNVQEQLMWGKTSTVTKQPAINKIPSPPGQYEPGSGGTTPNWYVLAGNGSTVGQATGLLLANNCPKSSTYPNGECYTMADRGTFNKLSNAGQLPNLQIVSQHNDPTARGGQNLLINPFSVYIVNPDKFADGSKPDVAAGTRFADFITSPAFQASLANFPTAADPAFYSDAFPSVTGTVPATASVGGTVPMSFTLNDKLPPQLAIPGIPVQLQASTDGGQTYTNVGDPFTTGNDGVASFSPTVSATTTFRVTTPRFAKFSPSTTVLGVVSVPQPAATPTPIPVAVDKTPPTISKAALTGRTLTLTVSEKSTIQVVVAKKVTKTTKVKGKKKTKTTYVTAKKLELVASGAGVVRTKFNTLKPATYKITIVTTDAAGNKKTQVVSLVLKAKKTVSKSLK